MKTTLINLILILLFIAGSTADIRAQISKKVIEKHSTQIGVTPISKKYKELGGEAGILGKPTSEEKYCSDKITKFRRYEQGAIYYHPDYTPIEIHGDIFNKWAALGYEKSVLGLPTMDEKPAGDKKGRYSSFEKGVIIWHPDLGAFEMHGEIAKKWIRIKNNLKVLGYPTTDEMTTPDKVGRYNHFQYGSIYWHPNIGAYEVHGEILKKWAKLGYEKSVLGYPKTDEMTTPDKVGRYNHFQHGSIYWSPNTGAHEVHGEILKKWAELGYEKSYLGYPISDEMATPDKQGRYSRFERGTIFWTPSKGAYVELKGK